MRRAAKAFGAGLILVTATACGQGWTAPGTAAPPVEPVTSLPSSAPAPPATQPPVSQPTQGVPGSDRLLPPSQIDVSALPQGYPHELSSANGGAVLDLHAEEGGCLKVSAAAGEQNEKQVVVLVTQTNGPKGQMCAMHIREVVVPVTLNAPLGQRTVVLRQG
ncbi:hypothetical protein [Amycolatopsis sp. H20-H5]|uniref:hypothetical protein n=1 Tax=Amycolatopsis sp. H20-H5 TaxID=3046309 RepID=UPI002DB593A2|nr:hypothetical protein [Amycolatopsis sp. H20-H5]MEC3974778.1 hypothetical protein [Amycolatopsis sp. H20-H5]